MSVSRRSAALALPITVALLAGCTAVASPSPSGSSTPPLDSTTAFAEPITVDNCGTEVTFTRPPQRVVTIKSTSTEMLLALGLGDRVVGVGFQDGPLPETWAREFDAPVLADQVPSEEVVLEREPDLVYTGWESNFSAEGAGTRADLAALGVASYVSPSACQSSGQPARLTWENVFADIAQVGRIFGVEDRAQAVIAQQRDALGALAADAGLGRSALWYSSGADTPYVGAGIGAPQLLMDSIGLVNIAGDLDATWAPLNWEAVVDADPDVIILIDATWNTAQSKIERLESNPATAQLSAVQAGNYLVLPFAMSEAGVRSVEGAALLAQQLADLDRR